MEKEVGSIHQIAEQYELSQSDITYYRARSRRELFLQQGKYTQEELLKRIIYKIEQDRQDETQKMPEVQKVHTERQAL